MTGPTPPPIAQDLKRGPASADIPDKKEGMTRDAQCHKPAVCTALSKGDQIGQHDLHRRSDGSSSQALYSYCVMIKPHSCLGNRGEEHRGLTPSGNKHAHGRRGTAYGASKGEQEYGRKHDGSPPYDLTTRRKLRF
jgi:hypothetical protein